MESDEETAIRVLRHLNVSERMAAKMIEQPQHTLYAKLHGSGRLTNEDRDAIAQAVGIPKRVMRMQPTDALRFLLDREDRKAGRGERAS